MGRAIAKLPGMAAAPTESAAGPGAADPRIGTDLAARMPKPRAVSTARVERRMTELLVRDPALRAALFRFVDVRPACATPGDVTRHLHELLEDAHDSGHARRASEITGASSPPGRWPRSPPPASSRWRSASSSARTRRRAAGDHEAVERRRRDDRRPARRGDRHRGRGRPLRPPLRGHARGRSPRPPRARPWSTSPSRSRPSRRCCAPEAPERGIEGARPRLRHLLRVARDVQAPTCTSTWSPSTRARRSPADARPACRARVRARPVAGIVLQAYLVDSPEYLEELLDWAARAPARAPVHDPPGQGRLLGPRGRPGRPARLGAAGLHRPPRVRPQLRAADQAA